MIFLFIVSVVLLVWNAIYCTRKVIADFRGPSPASGVFGLFAVLGAVSMLSLMLFAMFAATSGVF